jgi:hypothetical protein
MPPPQQLFQQLLLHFLRQAWRALHAATSSTGCWPMQQLPHHQHDAMLQVTDRLMQLNAADAAALKRCK